MRWVILFIGSEVEIGGGYSSQRSKEAKLRKDTFSRAGRRWPGRRLTESRITRIHGFHGMGAADFSNQRALPGCMTPPPTPPPEGRGGPVIGNFPV